MRYLISTALLLVCILSHAYVVEGVRTTVLIEGINRIGLKELSIEGCDTDSCSRPKNKSKCIEDGHLKFYCQLKDQQPRFVRFNVKFGGKILSSKFMPTNGESSLSHYKLYLTGSTVSAKPFKSIL